MVFARNETSASRLCQAWRERDQVKKLYLAKVVGEWPPFESDGMKHGTIEFSLAPSSTERLKWQVVSTGGKPSITHWRLLLENSRMEHQKESTSRPGVTLELEPITGRTHQLRIAVSVVGSGILGDSLYGDAPIEFDRTNFNLNRPTLHLHAYKLSFPHPKTGQRMDFIASPIPWDTT
jgi:tRNA pseudouridine32 synthase/23S rRNA pseudouridine746 synthase